MFFAREMIANVYDCDCQNKLKMSAAMKYMQQTSSDHVDYLGISGEKLYRENMVFLLSKSCVKVFGMPEAGQKIVIRTAPVATKGARFIREFIMEDASGNRFLSAVTLWLLVDPASRKIIRPSNFPYELPMEESLASADISDIDLSKLRPGVEPERAYIPVRYSDIDINQHVNNSVYADYICDSLPINELLDGGFDTFAISFVSEAKYGDIIGIGITPAPGGGYYLSGTKQDGSLCFESSSSLKLDTCRAQG